MDKEQLSQELKKLVSIMETLRGPEGCLWDRQQDYYSLQPYIVEEAYEVIEALQKKDIRLLKEELGDLLLQVVFQAQIGREKGDFNLIDVIQGISEKLIRRHPHVFQNEQIETVEELRVVWNEIKKKEKVQVQKQDEYLNEQNGDIIAVESLLDHVSRSQPALLQSYELQAKAATVGFDWERIEDVFAKVEEELEEAKQAFQSKNQEETAEEIGDLLFATVNLARFLTINPELALLNTILKFKDRFKYIEDKVAFTGFELDELTLEELDSYWEESKTKIKGDKGGY